MQKKKCNKITPPKIHLITPFGTFLYISFTIFLIDIFEYWRFKSSHISYTREILYCFDGTCLSAYHLKRVHQITQLTLPTCLKFSISGAVFRLIDLTHFIYLSVV